MGHACAHELLADPVRVDRVADRFVDHQFARHVYFEAQRIDPWPGGSYEPRDPGEPTYEGTSILAGIQILQRMGLVTEYRWAFSAHEVAVTISTVGPVILGIPWYTSMRETDANRYIWPRGSVAGGHAIIVIAYDHSLQEVWLMNSWGRDFGLNGRCRMKLTVLDELLDQQGEACVPVFRAAA